MGWGLGLERVMGKGGEEVAFCEEGVGGEGAGTGAGRLTGPGGKPELRGHGPSDGRTFRVEPGAMSRRSSRAGRVTIPPVEEGIYGGLHGIPPDVVMAVLALVGSWAYPPLARRKLVLHRCVFRELTGIPCPTCGLTRSLALAVRGKLAPSFRQHLLGPPLLALLLWRLAAFLAVKERTGREEIFEGWWAGGKPAIAGLFLAAWTLRLLCFGRDREQDEAFWKALERQ